MTLAVRAARGALTAAGRDPGEIDLLINTGVYRDENICEPAMAPFVQRGIGANPGTPRLGALSTFSFDLVNGGCGFLIACQVIDGFIRSGSVRRGMVVASDIDPAPRVSEGYPFLPVGGALLLGSGEADAGFASFQFDSFPQHARLFECELAYSHQNGRRSLLPRPRHGLVFRQDEAYLDHCAQSAASALERFLADSNLGREAIDLLICSQHPVGLPAALAARTGIPNERVPDATSQGAGIHTAAIPLALEQAVATGRWAAARNVLFVAVGAGISVALALYHKAAEQVAAR